MAARIVGHEIRAGKRSGIERDSRCVDALALPQLEEQAPERVVAEMSDIRGARALPRSCNRKVRRIAAEALQVARLAGNRLVEFDHRLADGNDVGHRALPLQFSSGPGRS